MGVVGYPRVPCSAAGLRDLYPAGSRCEWDQSQVGAEGKLGVLSLGQLCCCRQGWRGGLSTHAHSCHGGDLPEHSLLQSLPILCLGWCSLWHCSLSLARVGKQPLLRGGDTGACGGGRAALQLGWRRGPLGWCRVGWVTDCQFNC